VRIASALVTADRPGNCLSATLESLADTGFFKVPEFLPLHIFFDRKDLPAVSVHQGTPGLTFHGMSDVEFAEYEKLEPIGRCAFAHHRPIRFMAELARFDLLDAALVLEDDVVFSKGWIDYMRCVLHEISENMRANAQPATRWICSLYRLHQDVERFHRAGLRWSRVANSDFFGTQANIYGKDAVRTLPEWVFQKTLVEKLYAIDLAVCAYSEWNGIPTYISVPSVVQHAGRFTTGQSRWFHQSPCFFDAAPEWPDPPDVGSGGGEEVVAAAAGLTGIAASATIIQAGAYDASTTHRLAAAFGEDRVPAIHIFEPDPRNVGRIAGMTLPRNARLIGKALGVSEGDATLHMSDEFPMFSSTRKPKLSPLPSVEVRFQKTSAVPGTTLDGYAKAAGLEKVDLLWCDASGAEGDIFAGARETLKKTALIRVPKYRFELYEGQRTWAGILSMLHGAWEVAADFGRSAILYNKAVFPSNPLSEVPR